jgi:hypothetical protein
MIATRKGKNSRKNDLKWSTKDHIVGFYYYKWGVQFLEITAEEVADIMGTTVASMNMQKANFKMIDQGKGLTDIATGQLAVHYKYKNSPRYTVYLEVKKHLKLDDVLRKKLMDQKSFGGYRRLKPVETV